ncbi:MAG: hypothetical protein K9G76_00275 [Bacteroidales bacterium]|nr:hypothetical protein [Bacteroidales bacterium]MCF8402547.1 hypothetical protein [Bacteroidales bacterium]
MKLVKGVIILEGHVQGLANTRALGEKGIPVIVLDIANCLAQHSKYCKKFYKCPPFFSEEIVDFLVNLCNKEQLFDWLLIPSNDHGVYTISKHKKTLGKYFKISTPELSIIENIYDKEKLIKKAEQNNIATPISFFSPKEILLKNCDNVEFPLITRGKFGLSFYHKTKNKAYIARNIYEFEKQIDEIEKCGALDLAFTQNVIKYSKENKTISFTAFCIEGQIKTYWIGEKLRDHPIGFGTATLARSVLREELIEPSKKLVKMLKYTGVCEIEYLKDNADQEYKLIEINARTWLWTGLARKCGIDYANLLYNYVNNIEQNYPQKYEVGLYWMHLYTDMFFSILGILKGKYTTIEYFKSLFKKKTFAIFSFKDFRPFIFLSFSLIGYIKRR